MRYLHIQIVTLFLASMVSCSSELPSDEETGGKIYIRSDEIKIFCTPYEGLDCNSLSDLEDPINEDIESCEVEVCRVCGNIIELEEGTLDGSMTCIKNPDGINDCLEHFFYCIGKDNCASVNSCLSDAAECM